MKLRLRIALVCVALLAAGIPRAQDKKTPPPQRRIPVYFGSSNIMSGNVTKKQFDEWMPQGLMSKDSVGKVYKVDGFTMSYAERNLYEDSVGNLIYMTDLFSDNFRGDTLNTFWMRELKQRTKAGDTVYFDQITVRSPEGAGEHGKSMRIVIVK